ncbi:histidine kinase dimerization/phospho-acceptor domain-containing protein [Melittangium boletus]|uniref:histidine kinase n=1 Tax=Melittangium boletus DSM 14713 TaxID=1294270 RepID=A0A250INU4_9BACT|nr:histidine kinase dimerization/phospho-acceptor domain-containing protein [Melittangium boletus]ATB32948.1 Flagellar sensor histidine kinase FleS [Melittangium boletus DSM 14713]
MITSTAANSGAPSVREGTDTVVDAARYSTVPPLMDSLLHDVRNPLNALSIHLEVLTEKLKVEGQVPPSQEKNLKSMREQIQRVDGILRRFAEFIVSRPGGAGDADLTETVTRAMDVLAHESRKQRLQVRPSLAPGVRARLSDIGELGFLVLQALTRGYGRSEPGSEVTVGVRIEESRAVFEVVDVNTSPALDGTSESSAALELRCAQLGVDLHLRAGTCRMSFPLA